MTFILYDILMGEDTLTSSELLNGMLASVDNAIVGVKTLLQIEDSPIEGKLVSELHTKLQEAKSLIERINA